MTRNIISTFTFSILLVFVSCKDFSELDGGRVISPEEVKEAVYGNIPPQLVDVRTAEEYREGHLKNAVNICVTDDDFEEKLAGLNKDEPVYLYCRSGKRSATAAKIMKELGFREIYDMEGGYLNWEKQGFETEK